MKVNIKEETHKDQYVGLRISEKQRKIYQATTIIRECKNALRKSSISSQINLAEINNASSNRE